MTNTPRVLRVIHSAIWLALISHSMSAQSGVLLPPIIDVHYHGSPQAATSPDSLNVRYRVMMTVPVAIDGLQALERDRFLPAIGFPCDHGRGVIVGVPCLANGANVPDTSWLRNQIKEGRIGALAELVPQYLGMSPADARMDPYWSIAEEFDIPVGIHLGTGPPGAAYESSEAPFKSPEYRAAYNDPMVLEEVLMRHKKLRLIAMHAGWPLLEPMLALLYAHPGVFVDVGVLQRENAVPRAAYYRHLRGLIAAGFGKRIMFGSDFPTGNVRVGIDAILSADFLTADEKSDILCGNAMRFLRLPESVCRPGA